MHILINLIDQTGPKSHQSFFPPIADISSITCLILDHVYYLLSSPYAGSHYPPPTLGEILKPSYQTYLSGFCCIVGMDLLFWGLFPIGSFSAFNISMQ